MLWDTSSQSMSKKTAVWNDGETLAFAILLLL